MYKRNTPLPYYAKSPAKQTDSTMVKEAAREDTVMENLAKERGYKLEIVEDKDGKRKVVKVPVKKED